MHIYGTREVCTCMPTTWYPKVAKISTACTCMPLLPSGRVRPKAEWHACACRKNHSGIMHVIAVKICCTFLSWAWHACACTYLCGMHMHTSREPVRSAEVVFLLEKISESSEHIGNLSPGMHVHSMPRQMCGMHVHARLYIPFRPELWQGPKWWQP